MDEFKRWWDDQLRGYNVGYNVMPSAAVHNAAQTAFIAGAKYAASRCMKILEDGDYDYLVSVRKHFISRIKEEFDL